MQEFQAEYNLTRNFAKLPTDSIISVKFALKIRLNMNQPTVWNYFQMNFHSGHLFCEG